MKRHKGRVSYIPKINESSTNNINKLRLISREPGRITATQMKAVIMVLKRTLDPKTNSIAVKVFPHLAVTAKPLEVRMGKGKGGIDHRISRIRMNSVIVEVLSKGDINRRSLRAAGAKLGVRTTIE